MTLDLPPGVEAVRASPTRFVAWAEYFALPTARRVALTAIQSRAASPL
ncbi:MAG: hypothetical protein ACREF0_05815 [Acetobacteraceae bacterium]